MTGEALSADAYFDEHINAAAAELGLVVESSQQPPGVAPIPAPPPSAGGPASGVNPLGGIHNWLQGGSLVDDAGGDRGAAAQAAGQHVPRPDAPPPHAAAHVHRPVTAASRGPAGSDATLAAHHAAAVAAASQAAASPPVPGAAAAAAVPHPPAAAPLAPAPSAPSSPATADEEFMGEDEVSEDVAGAQRVLLCASFHLSHPLSAGLARRQWRRGGRRRWTLRSVGRGHAELGA